MKKLLFIFFIILLTGCTQNQSNITDGQDELVEEFIEEIVDEEETITADFYSASSCETNCTNSGYDNGSCMWISEAEDDYVSMGSCYINMSRHCGSVGQCSCYCYNVTEEGIGVQLYTITSPVSDFTEQEIDSLGVSCSGTDSEIADCNELAGKQYGLLFFRQRIF